MPFKDTPQGTTHFYGDGCKPPHRCPPGTCKRAYDNVCRVCNVDVSRSLTDTILKEFDEKFRYGATSTKRNDEISSFLLSTITRVEADTALRVIEEVEEVLSALNVMNERDAEWHAGVSAAIDEVESLKKRKEELK